MKSRNVVVVLVLVAAVVAGGLWLALRGGAPAGPGPDVAQGTAETAPDAPDTARSAPRKHARAHAWVEMGRGDVAGVVREFGTEKPLANLAVTLTAPSPGPDRTLETRTGADGAFHLSDVPNYDDWTLRVAVPAPLSDVEEAGVSVVEDKVTDLGVLYVTPGFSVPGIVVDEKGDPVEGAQVRALRGKAGVSQMDILRLIREIAVEPAAVDKATSGKDGKFALTKCSPGSYDLKVIRSGMQVLVERQVVVTPEAAKRELRLVMSKGHALDGRVVRNGPGTVAGIPVVALQQPQGEADFLALDRVFGVTDEEGKFHVEGLGAGRYVVAAAPQGEPFALNDRVEIPATTWIELTIEGDAWLEGRVTGKGGAAVGGAQVYVANFDRRPVIGNTRTDADGRYSIRGLKSGHVQLFLVQAEGYATWPRDLMSALQNRGGGSDDSLDLKPGRNERDVSLEPGGVIRGVIVSRDDEKPIEGVRVELGTILALFGGTRGATTDALGRFEIASAPLGVSVLIVSKDGWYQPGLSPMAIGMAFQGGGRKQEDTGKGYVVSITEPGQAVERTISLVRGSTLAGQVLAPDGTPVGGARVELVPDSDGGGNGLDQIRVLLGATDPRMTDSEGRFEMPGPPPGEKSRVLAKAAGFLDGRSEPVSATIGQRVEGVTVSLRLGATLSGTVTGADGRPLDGALVRWIKPADTNQWRVRFDLERAKAASTGADGTYRMEHVETGKIVVQVTHPQCLPQTFPDVAVEDGKAAVVDAKLVVGGVLAGRVLGADGQGASAAQVRIDYQRPPGQRDDDPYTDENRRVTTDATGAFRAEGLAAGTYQVRAEARGAAPSETVSATPGGAAITLRLMPPLRIAGFVRVLGAPAPGVQVEVRRAPGPDPAGNPRPGRGSQVASAETGPDGRFVVEELPAGNYELQLAPRSWGDGPRANVLAKTVPDVAAGNEGVLVEMEPGMTISGTVTVDDGQPASDGWVWVQQIDADLRPVSGGVQRWQAFSSGAFEVVGLVPGTYTVNVNVEGHGQRQLRADAGTRDLRVSLAGGAKIRGRVVNEDGTPATGVWVNAQSDQGSGNDQTDLDGRYAMPGLSPGRYTVTANWNDDSGQKTGASDPFELRSGDDVEIPQITLHPRQ